MARKQSRLRRAARKRPGRARQVDVTICGETFAFRLTLGGIDAVQQMTGKDPVPAIERVLRRRTRAMLRGARALAEHPELVEAIQQVQDDSLDAKNVLGALDGAEVLMEATSALQTDRAFLDDACLVLLWGLLADDPALTLDDVRDALDDPAGLLAVFEQAMPVIESWARRVPATNGQARAEAETETEGN